jgi:hypothetical protein
MTVRPVPKPKALIWYSERYRMIQFAKFLMRTFELRREDMPTAYGRRLRHADSRAELLVDAFLEELAAND